MHFTHRHQELQHNLKRFIDSDINLYVDEWEMVGMFPTKQLFKKMGELGPLGIARPTGLGSLRLDYSYTMAMVETLGYIHYDGVLVAIGVQTDMATPVLARFGLDELYTQFLAPTISSDAMARVSVSEPSAGSDAASIKTTARKDGDDYIINGSRMQITSNLQANWMYLLANTSDGPAHHNKSLIIVPMNTKGTSIGKKIRKISMNSSDTGLICFDDMRVPQHYRIGEGGKGFTYQMLQFQEERLWAVADSLTTMTMYIKTTVEYAYERKLFGVSLLGNQWAYFELAELKAEAEVLYALTYRACDLYIQGQDMTELASMAKLKAGCLARVVSDACLQLWGGMDFTWDNPIPRYHRDRCLGSTGDGAGEVMLGVICKYMNTLPGKKG